MGLKLSIKQALRGAESRLSLNKGWSKFGFASQVRSGWGGRSRRRRGGDPSDRSRACLSTLLNSYIAAVFKQHTETGQRGSAAGPEKEVWYSRPSFSSSFPGTVENRGPIFPSAIHLTQTPAGRRGGGGEGRSQS